MRECKSCGCEYNEQSGNCPRCAFVAVSSEWAAGRQPGDQQGLTGGLVLERSIWCLVNDKSGEYVRDLDRARCSTCLRRLSCRLVGQARKAKPGMLIAGLVIDGRNLRCRQYKYAGGGRRPETSRASQLELL